MLRPIVFLAFMITSTLSHAWVVNSSVTIKEMVQWEGSGYVVTILSNNNICFAPLSDKELYSLLLGLYMSGKIFTAHCHDPAENINGYSNSHKIHRINGN
jgi:hypothetical protein